MQLLIFVHCKTVYLSENTLENVNCLETTQFFAHATDCSKFIQYLDNWPIELQCPDSMLWNEKLSRCDWPHNVICAVYNVDDNKNFSKKSTNNYNKII